MNVTARLADMEETFYQPSEGGWRCTSDGPLRRDLHGRTITYRSLDEAVSAFWELCGSNDWMEVSL